MSQPWTKMAAAAVVSAGVTYALVSPSERAARSAEDYDRVRHVAFNHEACLRDLSYTDSSPSTLAEARQTLGRVRSRADDCFHGRW